MWTSLSRKVRSGLESKFFVNAEANLMKNGDCGNLLRFLGTLGDKLPNLRLCGSGLTVTRESI
jgi:hypothetical protein